MEAVPGWGPWQARGWPCLGSSQRRQRREGSRWGGVRGAPKDRRLRGQFKSGSDESWTVERGRGRVAAPFPLRRSDSGAERECFRSVWVMRFGRVRGIIEVRTGTGNQFRCRVGVAQTKTSLWPPRSTWLVSRRSSTSRRHQRRSSSALTDLIPTCYRVPQLPAPSRRGRVGWEIARLGSPRPGGSVPNEAHRVSATVHHEAAQRTTCMAPTGTATLRAR